MCFEFWKTSSLRSGNTQKLLKLIKVREGYCLSWLEKEIKKNEGKRERERSINNVKKD